MTREQAIKRIAEIDKMFADANDWGSWMAEASKERNFLFEKFDMLPKTYSGVKPSAEHVSIMRTSIDNAAIKGVVAIWTDAEGRVIAAESNFDTSCYSGFTLPKSQSMRARSAVQREVIRQYCSPAMYDCLDGHTVDRIAELMMCKDHKITLRAVGYNDAEKNEIERP